MKRELLIPYKEDVVHLLKILKEKRNLNNLVEIINFIYPSSPMSLEEKEGLVLKEYFDLVPILFKVLTTNTTWDRKLIEYLKEKPRIGYYNSNKNVVHFKYKEIWITIEKEYFIKLKTII